MRTIPLNDAEVYENPLKEQEILLRGRHIATIGELGQLPDKYDSIDLTHNDFTELRTPFPCFSRLKTLLLAHNNITHIDADFFHMAPSLRLLSLAFNGINEYNELSFLKYLPQLTTLVLEGCPITKNPDYRVQIAALSPSVRDLDFQKVSLDERKRANEISGSASGSANQLNARRIQLLKQLEETSSLEELDRIELELKNLG